MPFARLCRRLSRSPLRLVALALAGALLAPPSTSAQILEAPQAHDFGVVKVGRRVTGHLALRNQDDDDATVRVVVSGPPFEAAADTVRLPGRGGADLEVSCRALAPGPCRGNLELHVDRLFGSRVVTVALQAVAERPRLELSPEPGSGLALGSAAVGQTVRRTLAVANRGRVDLLIDSLSLDGGDLAFTLERPGALRLEPGARQDLPVAFTPRRDGPVAARLLIHSSDLAPPVVALPVSGAGLAPELALSPLPEVGLDFGPVEVGQSRVERLTVLNRGRADLHVRRLEATGGGFSTAAADSLPAIPPGSRSAVSVTFAPRYEGAVQGAVLLSSDDPDRPEVSLPLQGLARISPAQVEVISPATIAFGSVPIGRTAHQQLLLWNRGGSPFTAGLRLTGGQGEFELATEAMLLQPGQSGKVELAFSPKEVGGRAAALQVATEGGVAEYRLEGTGKYLQLSPAVWDFGRVPVGESSSAVIELANTGNADFTVSRISTSNDDYAVHTQVSADSEYLLPANSRRSLPVTVTFAPAARGLSTGALRAEGFWEEGTETFDVLLNGTGVAAEVELHPSGSIDFGYVVLGQTQVSTLVATNTGDTALRVETNPLTREARVEPAAFSLDPGESTQLQVYFTPEALGERFGQILLVSNDVRDKAQPIKIVGKGALESIDLTRITRVQVSRKSVTAPLAVSSNNNPAVLHDGTKIDLVFDLPDSLRQALVGRRISIEWVQLDENYDPKGGSTQSEVQIYGDTEGSVLAETLNLRLKESDVRRVRLRVTTRSYPDAPPQTISQVFEAGGWKWEFEAKPLVSFLTVRPGRTYTDGTGQRVQGKAERLIGLPGLAFVGWHNSEGPSISGLHLTAIGNVLEALSTENAIAVSLGLAVSLYKDRFLIGFGYDIYDSRPRAKRQGTEDYIFTFKYSGLFR